MRFRPSIFLLAFLFTFHQATAQSGCTDPQANNYNPAATTNDGSCTYPVTHKTPVLRAALNPIIFESSGLVWTDGQLWTHNDSGDPPDIYCIDTTDGHTLQTVIVDNYPNVDWEDITADSNYIYVGDHGNNSGDRTDLKVLKIAKADIGSGSTVHVNAQAISFSYTDQTSFTPSSTHNFDCEALISIKDSLYIFTKDRGDNQTRVYKMPKVPGTYALTPYTSYNVGGLITGADYNPATNQVVLVGYKSGHTYSFLWYLSEFTGDMFFSGNKRRIEIGSSSEWQTEGVAWLSDNRLFISCEDTGPPPASLYVTNDNFNTTGFKEVNQAQSLLISPNPVSETLSIDFNGISGRYQVRNMSGQILMTGLVTKGPNEIDVKNLTPGNYVFEARDNGCFQTSGRFEKK